MGRPRDFDEDEVVAQAMDLFWHHGFEGTSLDVLEQGTGLNRSSLYSTFGSKLDLFSRALDSYRAGPCRELSRPLRRQRGAEALRGYLEGLRAFVRSPDVARGCLMVNTSLGSPLDDTVRKRVDGHFGALRESFQRAYNTGCEDASVSATLTPEEAADWLLTFVRGVLAGAVAGESVAVLEGAIDSAAKQLGLSSA